MGVASYINDKILDPFIETHAIAPRMAVCEAELQERLQEQWQAREAELQEMWQARIQDNDAQWAGWLARRDAARALGLEFKEPRPDEVIY